MYFDYDVIGRNDIFFIVPALLLSLRLFLYVISFLLFPCASVWENTLASVPHFLLYGHTEWYLFLRGEIVIALAEASLSKSNQSTAYLMTPLKTTPNFPGVRHFFRCN